MARAFAKGDVFSALILACYMCGTADAQSDEITAFNRRIGESAGKYGEAISIAERSLALTRANKGEDDPETAAGLHSLAMLYHAQGRYADAEPLHKRALAIREKVLGPDHQDVWTSLNYLASAYKQLGRYAEAEPLYKRALSIREKALGSEHPEVAISISGLA